MASDLTVYCRKPLPAARLRGLFDADVDVDVESVDDQRVLLRAGSGTVTIDGPSAVPVEDVPADARTSVSGGHSYLVTSRGVTGDVHEALARRIAEAARGVLHSVEGVLWPAPKATRPARDSVVERITLAWYGQSAAGPNPLAALWEQAEGHVPEARPRRFGEWEPLKGNATETGLAGMEQAREAATQTRLFFTCAGYPATEGFVSTRSGVDGNSRHHWMLQLEVVGEPFADPTWRRRLEAFFRGVAQATSTLYAKAEVTGGAIFSGGRMASNAATEKAGVEWSKEDGFLGLPQAPVWWSWFSPGYRPLIAGDLASPPRGWRVADAPSGTFVGLAEAPATVRELRPHVFGKPVPGGWFASNLLTRGSGESLFGKLCPARVLP